MQIILLFVLAAAAVGAFLFARARRRRGGEILDRDGIPVRVRGVLPMVAALAVVFLVLIASVRVVPVGHNLVIFNTVTKSFRAAEQGVAFVPPFIASTHLYDMRRLEYTMSKMTGEGRRPDTDDSLWSPTAEGLQVGIDITVWHHIAPDKVIEIHQKIGPDFEEKIIRPAIRSVIRLVISEYAVMDVYSSKRARIQEEINAKVKALVEKDGFVIDEIVLRDVRFTDQFAQAIEQKQIAQQSAEQMKYVLEKEQREAERKVIEAEGRANAIEKINEALRQNPNYIRYLYVDKLSDKISVIVSDQNTIMDLKGILDARKP
ncbi:MAG TPA: prohibitin family protein [Candidatus Polarisedimenticolaceae bacterium]